MATGDVRQVIFYDGRRTVLAQCRQSVGAGDLVNSALHGHVRGGRKRVAAPRHRHRADIRRGRHHLDPAVAQNPRLGAHHQPPLPLIQVREQHGELGRQQAPTLG